jgi:ketosteroid isomerase-like protein
MSQENVEIVRRYNEPLEGNDVIPAIREALEQFGPDPQPDAVLAAWAEDPTMQHLHAEIEWDVNATGAVGGAAHGPREMLSWWAGWLEAWKSYAYRILEYRDLGDWVLTPAHVHARGRGGIAVEMLVFHLWQVRDGKIAVQRAFLSEQDALEAVGMAE